MRTRLFTLLEPWLLMLFCVHAHGQTCAGEPHGQNPEKDPVAILELGPATSWNIRGGAATFAPSLAAEVTPIENWLELEAGVAPFYTSTSTEWDTDLLFKKPWTISRKAEFMAGVGPQWTHLRQGGKTTDSIAAEVAGDFMFWPSGKHRFGWFLEPAYDYSFASNHLQSLGMTAGLLIALGGHESTAR